MKLLVTGGAGFIGSHFVRHIIEKYPEYQVINLDKLTYAGDLNNVKEVESSDRYRFVKGDISDANLVDELASQVDVMVNFAAETHVDRSIEDSFPFIKTNVVGTQVLIEAALKHQHHRYVQVSTDEVYGDIEKGYFSEESPLKPSSPYSASKAAGDMLALAYFRTHRLPVVISRCSNNYGSRQYPEKVIPLFIKKLLAGEQVPLYGDGSNVRDWLHVKDHCRAIDLILHKGHLGEVYNIGTHNEYSNLEITRRLLSLLNLNEDRIDFVKDRPGHDVRYAVDSTKIQNELGWKAEVDFEKGFEEMVNWYVERYG